CDCGSRPLFTLNSFNTRNPNHFAIMATLRRSMPLLERSCKLLSPRHLHTTSHLQATRSRPSPRVARAARANASTPTMVRVKKESDPDDFLPPSYMLDSAIKAGALKPKSGADTIIAFLRDFQPIMRDPDRERVQELCMEHDVTPTDMTILMGILRRCQGPPQQTLAKYLALAAADLGEKTAIFELIQSAINSGHPERYSGPLRELQSLAVGENDPEAMVLLGKVNFAKQRDDEAMEWFQKATRRPNKGSDGSEEHYGFAGAGEALVFEGRIHLKRGQKEAAESSFTKAALDLDHPNAYFHLSQLENPGSPNERVYLLKAASSGIHEACHQLGLLELENILEQKKKLTSLEDYGMALEWYSLAAANGSGLGMLSMASFCKKVGKMEDALAWLDKAEEVLEVRNEALELKREWTK
ncbi:hypothetical protein LSUE1_G001797, partial [Lachnellula suecica]